MSDWHPIVPIRSRCCWILRVPSDTRHTAHTVHLRSYLAKWLDATGGLGSDHLPTRAARRSRGHMPRYPSVAHGRQVDAARWTCAIRDRVLLRRACCEGHAGISKR